MVSDGELTDTATITIFPRWDVDRNGVVDEVDRSLIAAHFEDPVSACPNCDVNLDKAINIADYSLGGQYIDSRWERPPGASTGSIRSSGSQNLTKITDRGTGGEIPCEHLG
ncbi:MAG: hypothetical protein U9N46_07520 [Euryarchaeota archaeon]|nr:hypothetical protein [Euryarchaeota archaeon]